MSSTFRLPTTGLTVNLRRQGDGPPLLFLGGSNFDLSVRAPVFDSDLARHFTVAAADPRGLGATDAPDGDWTMEDYARDAVDTLDALGWTRVHVLGESFGAMVALHLAARSPERIQALALVAGSAGGMGGSSYPIHEFLLIDDPFMRARAALRILDTRFRQLEVEDQAEADRQIEKRMAFELAFLNSHDNRRGYPRLLATRAGHDAWSLLPQITVPTMIFHGLHDGQAPSARSERMADAMPNASLYAVPAGHGLCFAHPEPVRRLLANWRV